MNIAIPVYENRVMPRFGCARQFVIAHIDNGQLSGHKFIHLNDGHDRTLPELLTAEHVTLIICGGIHPRFQHMLRQLNIDVVWGVRGEWRQVIQSYLAGSRQLNVHFCQHHRKNRKYF